MTQQIVCGYCGAEQGHCDMYKIIAQGCKECGKLPEFTAE